MRDVIVTGTGRSGTSLLAGTLASAGYGLGGTPYPPRDANPKGFFETHEVNGVNELLLAPLLDRHPRLGAGQRWLATPTPAALARLAPDEALGRRIARLCAGRPFCFKDPRFAWTLPAWRPHLGDALLLASFRDPAWTAASIVRECASADYLSGVEMSFERALNLWEATYRRLLALADERAEEWRFVHYEQLATTAGLERLEAWTRARVARDFADPRLARSRSSEPVGAAAAELYAELCRRAGFEPERPLRVAVPAATVQGAAGAGAAPGWTPELSVIVCTYQRRAILERCLASFAAQTALGRYEIVVVDDGSSDGTREFLDRATFAVPTTVVHRPNGGLAAARNSALERARGKILLFVNDDTLAFPDLVEAHLTRHARLANREAAVLGTFEQPRAARDHALTRCLEDGDLVFRYKDLEDGGTYDANRFWTCNVSAPAAAVRRAGGFDESFRHYGAEDIDLGVRLEALGCRVVHDKSARAQHEHVLDFDQFARRQRLVARAFVRLFRKHPHCLAHPDWSWMRHETLASLEEQAARGAARAFELEQAARELSRIDLGAFEATRPTMTALAGRIVRTLDDLLRELNLQWWREGFADGLREFELGGFDELEPQPQAPVRVLADAPDAETALARLEELRELAGRGAADLATLEAIRLGAALAPRAEADGGDARAVHCALLNDLAVLRHRAGDRDGALAVLRAALALDTVEELRDLTRSNLSEVELGATLQRIVREAKQVAPATGSGPTELNAWVVHALAEAERAAGFAGKDVIEVGGAVPEKAALATGARSWRACFLDAPARSSGAYEVRHADARALPFADASCDLVFSSCAFEHIQELGLALAEMRRVLRPGGAVATLFAPIWSCAVGHHLWLTDDQGRQLSFMDGVVPDWGHLLLDEAELGWFLGLARSPRFGRRAAHQVVHVPHVNRVLEGDFERLFAASGLDAAGMRPMTPWVETPEPSPELAARLASLHPAGGSFRAPGFVGTLVKAPLRVLAGLAR